MDPFKLERRKHPRFSIDLPAKYWRINIPQSGPARTGDISEGGVLLYLLEEIQVGQDIGVKIFTSAGSESKSIEAFGRVVWSNCESRKEEYKQRTGVKFVDISAENLEKLKEFLNAQMKLDPPSQLNIPAGLCLSLEISIGDKEDRQLMVDEPSQKEEWKSLNQRKKETFPAEADGKKKDATMLSPELIYDFQEEYSDEQRQNLYHKILDMGIPERQRLAIFGNREGRSLLIRDPNKMISLAVLKNAKVNETEVLQYAQRRDLSQDIILAIAQDPKWKKNYPIKFALVSNPKTPLPVSISFVSHLQERDLKLLSRNKNVSSVLRRRAGEILHKKIG